MAIANYRDLVAWHAAMALAEDVYKTTRTFPRSEIYGLSSQLQRSAVSVPSNIAEGHGRRSRSDFARFLAFSLGSLAELETQVQLAARLNYVDRGAAARLIEQADRIGRMLFSLRRKMLSA